MNEVTLCLARFKDLFNGMSSHNTGELGNVYADQIMFTDPFTTVHGLPALQTYLAGAYGNVIACSFEFEHEVVAGQQASLTWTMHLQHKRIKRGAEIRVDGISYLQFDQGRVIRHRDYFDAGQLLYENLPVLGSAVKWLRRHAA